MLGDEVMKERSGVGLLRRAKAQAYEEVGWEAGGAGGARKGVVAAQASAAHA